MYSICLLNRNLQTLLATANYYAISFATSYVGTVHPDNHNLLNPIPAGVQAIHVTSYTCVNGINSTWKVSLTNVVFLGHPEIFQFHSNSVFLDFVCNTMYIPLFSMFFYFMQLFSLFPLKLA